MPPSKISEAPFFPPAADDSSRHRVSKWFRGASGNNLLVHEGQQTERIFPRPRNITLGQIFPPPQSSLCHAWTDGSFGAPPASVS